jgi:hypothetical protein
VAEQISHVYSRDAERRMENPDDAEGGIGRELDLGMAYIRKLVEDD